MGWRRVGLFSPSLVIKLSHINLIELECAGISRSEWQTGLPTRRGGRRKAKEGIPEQTKSFLFFFPYTFVALVNPQRGSA